MEPELFNVQSAADLLGLSYKQTDRAIREGHVRPLQVGRSRLLTGDHVEQLRKLFDERKKASERA